MNRKTRAIVLRAKQHQAESIDLPLPIVVGACGPLSPSSDSSSRCRRRRQFGVDHPSDDVASDSNRIANKPYCMERPLPFRPKRRVLVTWGDEWLGAGLFLLR